MIMWNIKNESYQWEIEVGDITILKGSNIIWYKLVRLIEDFFENKASTVKIYEDTQLLHKKDWECLFIPFDAHLQLDKINSKSPLKFIVDEVCNELELSPIYHEILDVWEALIDEVELMNHRVEKYGLDLKLELLKLDVIRDALTFSPINKEMTPIEYKKLLLSLFAEKYIDKKRLIIVELPELYADDMQLSDFLNSVKIFTGKGIKFIIVTQQSIKGNTNYLIDNKIINISCIDNLKRKVQNEVPFVCDDELFQMAKINLLQAVDNYKYKGESFKLLTRENSMLMVVIFVILFHIDIKLNLDTSRVESNIKEFIKSYS